VVGFSKLIFRPSGWFLFYKTQSLRIIAPAILGMIEMSFGERQTVLAFRKLAHRLHIDLICSPVLPVIIPCQVINYKVASQRDIVAEVHAFFGRLSMLYASMIRSEDQRIV
jgi:hypothetical protein